MPSEIDRLIKEESAELHQRNRLLDLPNFNNGTADFGGFGVSAGKDSGRGT